MVAGQSAPGAIAPSAVSGRLDREIKRLPVPSARNSDRLNTRSCARLRFCAQFLRRRRGRKASQPRGMTKLAQRRGRGRRAAAIPDMGALRRTPRNPHGTAGSPSAGRARHGPASADRLEGRRCVD
eukprot:5974298-Alexandrium_andersonii.AAC.1